MSRLYYALTLLYIFPSVAMAQAASAFTDDAAPQHAVVPAAIRDANTSLFIRPRQFERYQRVIELYETGGDISAYLGTDEAVNLLNPGAETVERPPLSFPHHYLSSIIFHRPSRWMVRVNGITLTSETNSVSQPLYVSSISEKKVELYWTPQDDRMIAALLDGTNIDRNLLNHRKHHNSAAVQVHSQDGRVRFVLEPNQLFYSRALSVYEGNPRNMMPLLAPAPVPTTLDSLSGDETIDDSVVDITEADESENVQDQELTIEMEANKARQLLRELQNLGN